MKAENKALIIRKKQIDLLYQNLPAMIIGLIIAISTVSYVLWDIESIQKYVIGWFVLNVIVLSLRYLMYKRYKKIDSIAKANSCLYKSMIGSICTGIINGSFIFALSSNEQLEIFYIFLMVSAMVMATVVSIGIIKEAYIVYVASLTAPMFSYFIIHGGEQFFILMVSLLTIVIFSILGAFRFSNSLETAFSMEVENSILRDDILVEYGEKIIAQNALELKATELEKLNKTLEYKVEQEVSKNVKQTQILYQQSKMASMGEMIGNIAHQWRQPLNSISVTASTLKLEKQLETLDDDSFYNSVDFITNSTKQLSQTIDDFRNFFKTDKSEVEFSILEVIQGTVKLLDANFKNKDIQIVYNIDNIYTVGLKNEFTQAIINILNNAKDILIEKNISKKLIVITAYTEENDLLLTIHDNAGGVSDKIMHKIFEPYFSTKHQSSGTGIGLYMTEEIIKKHMKGSIFVQNAKFSHEGNSYFGAEFKIAIPLKENVYC